MPTQYTGYAYFDNANILHIASDKPEGRISIEVDVPHDTGYPLIDFDGKLQKYVYYLEKEIGYVNGNLKNGTPAIPSVLIQSVIDDLLSAIAENVNP